MPAILISYRRADAAAIVGRMYDRLVARYGVESVFLDISDIPHAVDFRYHVSEEMRKCDVILAIVGPLWRGGTGNESRINAEDDPVRVEIEIALEHHLSIIPVLVDGAAMPGPTELPVSLRPFAYLNAATVQSGLDFHAHVDRLVASIDQILGPKAPAAPDLPRRGFSIAFAIVTLALLVLPLGAERAGITPPWPRGLAVLTAVLEAALIFVAFSLFRTANRGAIRKTVTTSIVVLVFATVAYLGAQSVFVYQTPVTGERFAKGFVCTAEARAVFKDKCPFLDEDELRGAEYDAQRLWTLPSIAIVKVTLSGLWLLAFVAIGILGATTALLKRDARRVM